MSQQPPGGWTPVVPAEATPAEPERPADVGGPAEGVHAANAPAGAPPSGVPDEKGAQGEKGKDKEFSFLEAFGGWGGLLDAGLPGVAFLTTYSLSGRDLRLAL